MIYSNKRRSRSRKYEQKPPLTFLGVVLLKSERDERKGHREPDFSAIRCTDLLGLYHMNFRLSEGFDIICCEFKPLTILSSVLKSLMPISFNTSGIIGLYRMNSHDFIRKLNP